ncbi:hypothetical protein HZC30_07040, partial [Candidatus Woesearchaeota archaeon]|nr:hypothetical protein [Candidatus Woesearchaeota archaeon]
MKLTQVEKLILYSLGQFYQSINQPLVEKPLTLRTSKITFIEWMLHSGIISKQERALYRNLESLEKGRFIKYDTRMIMFTNSGLKELENIKKELEKREEKLEKKEKELELKRKELQQFRELEKYFISGDKP